MTSGVQQDAALREMKDISGSSSQLRRVTGGMVINSAPVKNDRYKKIKSLIVDGLIWCALAVLLAAGFINQSAVRQYTSVSLRYNTQISGQAAYAARQYSIARSEEGAFWPSFWNETTVALESEFVAVSADCVEFSGEVSLIWPATYIKGSAPGVMDSAGCAVSEALAWRLWGSSDVVGMTVQTDGNGRVVRGVFKGEHELILIPFHVEDKTQSWSAVELSGSPTGAARSDALSYANAAGLGKPESILVSGTAPVAGFMSVLPLLILAVYGLSLIIGIVRARFPIARKPVFFLGLIAFAVALPVILGALPAWSIPTRWSDFSFWASLITAASSGIREFLQAAPMLRDVELRILLLKQTGIAFIAVCGSLSVCFRWHIRRLLHPLSFKVT